ncbi:hypothetical protein BO82DRAFT_324045 [Aspergillus uvarum CBS 121591]|uniref:Protein kinase domain-containing protein n=1 Tax=Aspergillus uvarum CBS 121591 TaxID=1448315 RepID=A0A319BRY6_9EURO|nr:hypothetical protein BO82DRAFT_324045 [Aspergillus uvarum CBS 121591]PYH75445.1 hypothetical protein BO82DRAFT_324045 [Aspergillus uvarum CBS 121591]
MVRPVTQIDPFKAHPQPTTAREPNQDRKKSKVTPSQIGSSPSIQNQPQISRLPATTWGSPWIKFKERFTCELAGPTIVAENIKNPSKIIHIREFSKHKADLWIDVLRCTYHPNIVYANEIFRDHGLTYFVVDDYPLTLENLVACNILPSELQLASILRQILDGLSYLLDQGFEHAALTCSNILIGQDGAIQIAALEHCTRRQLNQSHTQSIRSIADITMLLMQKYLKPGKVIGIDNLHWQSEALEFLSATASVVNVQDLKRLSLFKKHQCSKDSLLTLTRLAFYTTKTWILKEYLR